MVCEWRKQENNNDERKPAVFDRELAQLMISGTEDEDSDRFVYED